MEWIDFKKYVPHCDVPVIFNMSWGEEREAIFRSMGFGFVFTDCTHPLMNAAVNKGKILGWRFKYIDDFEKCRFSVNHYEREKEGECILSSALTSKRSFLNRLLNIK